MSDKGKLPPPLPPPPRSSPSTSPPPPPPARIIPKPPPTSRKMQATAPTPSPEGFMTTQAKMSLADIALQLRDEQLEARVVLYKAELETNSELDAITQQVIKELQSLQKAARASQPHSRPPPTANRAQLETELSESLKEMLSRIFRPGKLATTIERKLGEVSKRFARVFFESELHDRIRGAEGEAKTMRYAEQALYHALRRSEQEIFAALDSYAYSQDHAKRRAREQYLLVVKGLRNDFLARTTPELNALVKYLNEALSLYFTQEMPPTLGELAWQVVKEAKLAEARTGMTYKISASAFSAFRTAFEKRFLQKLVPWVEEEMLKRVRENTGEFRVETIRFVADPVIFSDVCEVVCDAIYDMLYNDGFLDLPSDWRARLTANG